ncbi:MAG: hypothetical protein OXH59_15960, partial [Rhodospirillaceae bacterium]|nr:hypothetical protein [Rhodospirillaceae bacterium]
IGAEQSGVLKDHPGLRPDIVIRHPGGAPVIVETEFEPADTVEDDARARLDKEIADTGNEVETTVAVRVPAALRGDQGRLAEQIAAAEFRYCVFSQTEDGPRRWPESGWLDGGIDDLAGLIEQTALSERRIAEGMRILEEGVSQAAKLLRVGLKDKYPDVLTRIATALHQEEGEQTSRMATAIFANALTVHSGIAGTHGVPPLDDLRSVVRKLSKGHVVEAWYYILDEINYWPIFKVALDVLLGIPDAVAQQTLHRLHGVARDLDGIGAVSTQDLAGQMFGRLIADRKFLATFYTLPSSAALLAELAVAKLDLDWADAEAVKALRIADLACGTGVLLSATYRVVAARHRRGGGDDEALHRAMMEEALIGADIMPAATHLTASMLSSAHPALTFGRTRIHTMPYGMQDQDSGRPPALGSLDLITSDKQPSLFGTGEHVLAGDSGGVEVGNHAERGDEIRLPHASADLVIMNPPFTRPTNHEAGYEVPVPSFAGFATSADEQKHMSAGLKKIRGQLAEPAGNGNAGLASNFIDLGHQKVKPGGVLALVLPITVVSGGAWAATRGMLARHYRDISVITIAASGQTGRSFSADTGMGEALIVAVKRAAPSGEGEADAPALYVSLRRRPRRTVDGAEIGRSLARLPSQATGLIHIGDQEIGCYVRASLADGGCASLREPDAAVAALELPRGALRLPRLADPLPVPVASLGDLGTRGLLDRDIAGAEKNKAGLPRGPFDVFPHRERTPTYPMLWAHDAARERRLTVAPDSEGRVRPGRDQHAIDVWETATRLHFNRDFRINSQSLAACLTAEQSIGGRAWPNFRVEGDPRREEALALWANTTPGLIAFWWVGGRQQQGRVILTISGLPSLPVLDVRTLTEPQLRLASRLFSDFASRDFLPANEAYRDDTRQDLDRAVLCELLGLPESILEPLALLRRQWCEEPTVHGGKSTRPGGPG